MQVFSSFCLVLSLINARTLFAGDNIDKCLKDVNTLQDQLKQTVQDVKTLSLSKLMEDLKAIQADFTTAQTECRQVTPQELMDYLESQMTEEMKRCWEDIKAVLPEIQRLVTDRDITVKEALDILADLKAKAPGIVDTCRKVKVY